MAILHFRPAVSESPLSSSTELPIFVISSQQRRGSTCSEIAHCEEFIDTILCLNLRKRFTPSNVDDVLGMT